MNTALAIEQVITGWLVILGIIMACFCVTIGIGGIGAFLFHRHRKRKKKCKGDGSCASPSA